MNVVTYSNHKKGLDYIFENKIPNYLKKKIAKNLKGYDWIWSWEIEKSLNKQFKKSDESDATYTHLTILGKIEKVCS